MEQRHEIIHHSADQIGGYLASALALADLAELSPEDRAACLPTLITLFAAKNITVTRTEISPELLSGIRRSD